MRSRLVLVLIAILAVTFVPVPRAAAQQ